MTEIELTTLRAANIARDKEWNTGIEKLPLTFRSTELAGEVGEACNVIKKLERERLGIRGSRDTVEHLAEELADVVICADLIAMDVGIDLEAAVRDKFNATSEKNGFATRLSAIRAEQARPSADIRQTAEAVARVVCAGPDVATGTEIIAQAFSALAPSTTTEQSRPSEPVAWRWKYDTETAWTLCHKKPEYFIDRDIEPLYLAPSTTTEERRQAIEECIAVVAPHTKHPPAGPSEFNNGWGHAARHIRNALLALLEGDR